MHKHKYILQTTPISILFTLFVIKPEKLNPVERNTEAILVVSSNLTSSN
jgi:hypothetical protein